MLKIAVIGSITADQIFLPEGKHTGSLGGILYNLLSFSYLNARGVRIYPVCNLGDDIYERVISVLRERKNIVIGGIKKWKAQSNAVRLFCRKSGRRREFLLSLVPGLRFAQVRPHLGSDVILVNFVSGYDLSLSTLERIRKYARKPIYIDIHSLTLGRRKNGERFHRKPRFWRRYIRCADFLQMNWEELLVLSGGKVKNIEDAKKWGGKILSLGPKALIVTLGKNGAFVVYRQNGKIRSHFSLWKTQEAVDTVGCGDVFASAFISSFLKKESWKLCLDFAVHVASFKSSFSGMNDMRRLSRFVLG